MIRKTAIAVTLAGALALGTASATTLGNFDDVSFAASDVVLLNCEISGDVLDFIPDVPDASLSGTDLTDFLALDTFALSAVDLSGLPTDCQDEIVDIVFIGSGAVLDAVTGIDLSGESDLTNVDVGSLLTSALDVSVVDEIRVVVSNNA